MTLIFCAAARVERLSASANSKQRRHSRRLIHPLALCCKRSPEPGLENQLEGKLNHPRIVHRLVDHAKRRRRRNVLHAAAAASQEELRMVEQVEELCSEI